MKPNYTWNIYKAYKRLYVSQNLQKKLESKLGYLDDAFINSADINFLKSIETEVESDLTTIRDLITVAELNHEISFDKTEE